MTQKRPLRHAATPLVLAGALLMLAACGGQPPRPAPRQPLRLRTYDRNMEAVTQFFIDWGYLGLFLSAFIAGSILPFSSEAVMIVPRDRELAPGIDVLERRIRGVQTAHRYVLMDYDIPAAKLEEAVAVAPGFESPTVSPLHDGEWVAVRVMVDSEATNRVMDRLYEIGARAILVTSILACRV